jgi:hypothetical protein
MSSSGDCLHTQGCPLRFILQGEASEEVFWSFLLTHCQVTWASYLISFSTLSVVATPVTPALRAEGEAG